MKLDSPVALLGGLSPAAFMKRHWQRKPLLIRQALPGFVPPVKLAQVRKLARRDDVESRLIWREDDVWQMESGPFARLPAAGSGDWTLLVQGVDLHDDATAALMHRFRFIPDARLDDVMISIAGDGGGVGPHFDSYDVFLLQAAGRRRWRIGRQKDLSLDPEAPLKILQNFQPEEEFVLEPGDMLYLPPQVAHDGIAEGPDCMTISIGFRSPSRAELARGMLETAADTLMETMRGQRLQALYRDPGQDAVSTPAALPEPMLDEAVKSVQAVRFDHALASRFLGAYLTEPKPGVVFEAPAEADLDLVEDWPADGHLVLDRRTRMLYRDRMLFINGEPLELRAGPLLRALADQRRLDCSVARPTEIEREMLQEWLEAGWLDYRHA
jgi:50S ribosomal protein L16 3-hydroxylase